MICWLQIQWDLYNLLICWSLWSMLTTHLEVLICWLELSIFKLIKETTCVMLVINNNIVYSLISRVVVLKVQRIYSLKPESLVQIFFFLIKKKKKKKGRYILLSLKTKTWTHGSILLGNNEHQSWRILIIECTLFRNTINM